MWGSIADPDRPEMIIWRMRIEYWVTKGTNTHAEYVILISSPLQQWLYEHASLLPYTCISCLVNVKLRGTCMPLGFEGLLLELSFLQQR